MRHWVGPMAENMRNVGSQFRRLTSQLTLTPEEYLQRNVRVSGFLWEPIDAYFDRFPWLQNVLVYGSDYPFTPAATVRALAEAIAGTPQLDAAGLAAATRTNAEALFPRFAR